MRIQKLFAAASLCVLLLFLGAQYTIYNSVKEQAVKTMNAWQVIHARQAATGIQDYMENTIRTLTILSEMPEVVTLDPRGRRILANYRRFSPDEIKGVTRVDPNGRILYTVPDEGATGRDISNQAHIAVSMETHKVVVSDVFMTVQGFRAVAVHVPVFTDKGYDGTLAFLLSFDRIAEKYIVSINVGGSGAAWVISQNGTMICSPIAGESGKNARELFKNFPDVLSLIDEMAGGMQGATTYHYDQVRDQQTENLLMHAVYMPIQLRNTLWSIAIATPEKDVIASLSGLRRELLIATIALLAIYGFVIYRLLRSAGKGTKPSGDLSTPAS